MDAVRIHVSNKLKKLFNVFVGMGVFLVLMSIPFLLGGALVGLLILPDTGIIWVAIMLLSIVSLVTGFAFINCAIWIKVTHDDLEFEIPKVYRTSK